MIQAVVLAVHVHGGSFFFLAEELGLEVPVVDSGANGEFEVFFGDRVPELLQKR